MKHEDVRAQVIQAIRQEIPFDTVEEQEVRDAADAVLALFETVTANTMGHTLACDIRQYDGRCDCSAGDAVMLRLRSDIRAGGER